MRSSLVLLFTVVFCFQGRADFFAPELRDESKRARGILLSPLASFLLPGFGQWVDGQVGPAAVYTGTALLGIGVASSASARIISGQVEQDTQSKDLASFERDVQQLNYGSQLYSVAGGLSAYHSFRTAVLSHHQAGTGRFDFLLETRDENVGDLLRAPFRLGYMKRPRVFIPVLLGGLAVASIYEASGEYDFRAPQSLNLIYGAGISYNAGVWEEAAFRGWLQPVFYDWFGNFFWANTLQASLFAAAHISPQNPVPLIQFIMGYYLGLMTMQNQWSLEESVFIHTWYDIAVFSLAYSYQRNEAAWFIPLVDTSF